jgi:hypothetical protein
VRAKRRGAFREKQCRLGFSVDDGDEHRRRLPVHLQEQLSDFRIEAVVADGAVAGRQAAGDTTPEILA